MFNSIEKLSYWITDKISNTDDEDKDYYQYAVHGILSFIVSSSFAILLSIVFGYPLYVILIIPSVLFIRSKSGGSHANTAKICFLWTNLMYLIIGLVSCYSGCLLQYSYIILFIFALWYGLTGLDDVPRYTKSATKHCDKKQLLFKMQYIYRLILFYTVSFLLIFSLYFNFFNLVNISCILSIVLSWIYSILNYIGLGILVSFIKLIENITVWYLANIEISVITNILSMSIIINRFSLSNASFLILERLK